MALEGRAQLERTRVDPLTQLTLRTQETKALVLRSKCRQQPQPNGSQGARPLDWLVPETAAEWPINCDAHAEICTVVREVAVERAVMAAVSNSNILGMLGQVRTRSVRESASKRGTIDGTACLLLTCSPTLPACPTAHRNLLAPPTVRRRRLQGQGPKLSGGRPR